MSAAAAAASLSISSHLTRPPTLLQVGTSPFHTTQQHQHDYDPQEQHIPQQIRGQDEKQQHKQTETGTIVQDGISYLSSTAAASIDRDLMSTHGGFSIDQLMELAGLSCACAIEKVYPVSKYSRILVICGPGNNGGDGLVLARHLTHFGYCIDICYPKYSSSNELYLRLLTQLENLHIPIRKDIPDIGHYHVVVDAIFGFSFKPSHGIREPFATILSTLTRHQSSIPIVSIDIPSGWDVDMGDSAHTGFMPTMLISLTAPKRCALHFSGIHYLGGRFVPPSIQSTYGLSLPKYSGSEQCVQLPSLSTSSPSSSSSDPSAKL